VEYSLPVNVVVEVKSRVVKVTGPRGTLTRHFKHIHADIQVKGEPKKNQRVQVDVWLSSKAEAASVRTVISHIQNMITGVTRGFEYKMRFVYAHFPINVNIPEGGKELEVRNFLGEKMVRKVPMLEGVTIARSEKMKDEIILTGNNLEAVSQSASNVWQSTRIHNKDIRKFLDGIYVSEKGVLGVK